MQVSQRVLCSFLVQGLSLTLSQSVRNCNWDAQQLEQYMQAQPGAACSYSELWARIKLLLARAVSAMPQVCSSL